MKVSKLLRGLGFIGRVAAGAAAQGVQSAARIGLEDELAQRLSALDDVVEVSVDRPVTSGGLARTYRARLTLAPGLDAADIWRIIGHCQAAFDDGRAHAVLDPRMELTVPVGDATLLLKTARWKGTWSRPVESDTVLQSLLDEARVGGGTAEARDGEVCLRFTAPLETASTLLVAARPNGVDSWLRAWEGDVASIEIRASAEPTPLRPALLQELVDAGVQRIHVSPGNGRSALRPFGELDDQQAAHWLNTWRAATTDQTKWRVSIETIGAWHVATDKVEAAMEPHTSKEWRTRSARIAALLQGA